MLIETMPQVAKDDFVRVGLKDWQLLLYICICFVSMAGGWSGAGIGWKAFNYMTRWPDPFRSNQLLCQGTPARSIVDSHLEGGDI